MFEELKAQLRQYEGSVPHMYLDSRGCVTCGIGHELPTALSASDQNFVIPFGSNPDEWRLPTAERTQAEWAAVKAMEPGHQPDYYRERTSLRLLAFAIDDLLNRDVAAMSADLAASIPEFSRFPEPAQTALLDMAFNLGVGGLKKFTHLMAAVRQRNWAACATQCHRAGIQDARNAATAALFRQAAAEGPAPSSLMVWEDDGGAPEVRA